MENELSRVVDALPGLVWTALPGGRFDLLNRRWCEYTGMKLAEACDCGWQSAVHPDDLSSFLERWRSILASGQLAEIEARFRGFDKEYRRFLLGKPMVCLKNSRCIVAARLLQSNRE